MISYSLLLGFELILCLFYPVTDAVYGGDNTLRSVRQSAKSTTQILTTDIVRIGCELLELLQIFLHIVCCIACVVVAGTRYWAGRMLKFEKMQQSMTTELSTEAGRADLIMGAEPRNRDRLLRRSLRAAQMLCGTAQWLQADQGVLALQPSNPNQHQLTKCARGLSPQSKQ